MVKEELLRQIKDDFVRILEGKKILGILLFGSIANDNETNRSDIDICVIAPKENPFNLYSFFSERINISKKRYDIKFFTELPLYIQIQVIENGILIYSPNELELYEYFYFFRKLWAHQKHRQELTREGLFSLLD